MSTKYSDQLQKKVDYLEAHMGNLVCDADSHVTDLNSLPADLEKKLASTPNYFHGRPLSAEQLLTEMDMAGVDVSLIWQNPAATAYNDSKKDNFASLKSANEYIAESSYTHHERFIPAGWTDPKALGFELASEMVKICAEEYHFPIIKLNPAQNAYPIDSDEVIRIVELIVSYGVIPAFHYGADTEFTPAEGLGNIAQHFSKTPIIAVHMGGGGASYLEAEELYNQSRELGLEHQNIRFVMSAKRDCHMESDFITYQMAGEPFCKNIFCGSDAPYGRQSFNFGGFRSMFRTLQDSEKHPDERVRNNPGLFTDKAVSSYLGTNLLETVIPTLKRLT